MNLRNSLFPLIVIVLLAYLASDTLLRDDVSSFRPTERKVVVRLTDGTEIKADYPRTASPPAFERLLTAAVAGSR